MAPISVWLNINMPQHITITTDFDITETKIIRKFKMNYLPMKTPTGMITSESAWLKARQQQSNRETIIQLISLRSQPLQLHTTIANNKWILEFDIDHLDAYKKNNDGLYILREDCTNVPMLTGLDENEDLGKFLITSGDNQNIWFTAYEF